MPQYAFVVVALAFGLAAASPSLPAFSRDDHPLDQGLRGHGHAQSHDWYQELKQPSTGYSCCNGTANGVEGDCRPTRAYLNDDGQWYALLEGRWVQVPPSVVLKQLAPDGRSHICANKTGKIYCFLGGSPRS